MEVKPKTNTNLLSSKSMDVLTRNDLKLLVEQLEKNGQEDVIINTGINGRFRSDVIKKHMEMDSAMGMYVVALIAGVSAAGIHSLRLQSRIESPIFISLINFK